MFPARVAYWSDKQESLGTASPSILNRIWGLVLIDFDHIRLTRSCQKKTNATKNMNGRGCPPIGCHVALTTNNSQLNRCLSRTVSSGYGGIYPSRLWAATFCLRNPNNVLQVVKRIYSHLTTYIAFIRFINPIMSQHNRQQTEISPVIAFKLENGKYLIGL